MGCLAQFFDDASQARKVGGDRFDKAPFLRCSTHYAVVAGDLMMPCASMRAVLLCGEEMNLKASARAHGEDSCFYFPRSNTSPPSTAFSFCVFQSPSLLSTHEMNHPTSHRSTCNRDRASSTHVSSKALVENMQHSARRARARAAHSPVVAPRPVDGPEGNHAAVMRNCSSDQQSADPASKPTARAQRGASPARR
eukprot:1803855-Rhodomonas_salina.2